jgi:hypothetical protein
MLRRWRWSMWASCRISSAKGAVSLSAWGVAPGIRSPKKVSAENAIQSGGSFSIPNIPLVELNAVLAQQITISLLKSSSAVTLLLRVNVLEHRLKLTWTHRKRAISALPREAAIPRTDSFHPFRRRFLYLLDQLRLRNGSRQCRDDVDMISNAADVHEVGTYVAADCR